MGNLPYNVFTFPVWWYTEGLIISWRSTVSRWRFVLRSTGLAIFVRHLKDPLYGDYTRSGIIISFFLRLTLLVFLLGYVLVRLVLILISFLVYVVVLPVTIVMIIYQLFPT